MKENGKALNPNLRLYIKHVGSWLLATYKENRMLRTSMDPTFTKQKIDAKQLLRNNKIHKDVHTQVLGF